MKGTFKLLVAQIILLLGFVFFTPFAYATTYTITDLGGYFSEGFAINNNGQATGLYCAQYPGCTIDAFFWQNGQLTDLGVTGYLHTYGGINNVGVVVGHTQNNEAYSWQSGTLRYLTSTGNAFGINDAGQIAGAISNPNTGQADLVVWQPDGSVTYLGNLGSDANNAFAINKYGEVVGSSGNPQLNTDCFLWKNGSMLDITPTYSLRDCFAHGINDSEHIVGFSQDTNSNNKAFLWENGSVIDLGTLGTDPNTTETAAYGINNEDQVVGSDTPQGDISHAFLWENGTMTDLNDLLPSNSGWVLTVARGINDKGQIIGIGNINNGTGPEHAFILSPVNPNQAPVVNSLPNTTINVGDTYVQSGSFTDSDSLSWTATVDYGDGSGVQPLSLSGTSFTLSHQYATPGTYSVTVSVTDDGGLTGTTTTTVAVNAPPVISSITGANINEGAQYSTTGSFTDADSTSWTATVDYGDGSGVEPLNLSGTSFSLSHIYQDNGTYTAIVTVTDNQGATGTSAAIVTVNNVAPSVGAISASVNPVQVNNATNLSANFTDPGVLDTHTARWDFGDGSSSNGTVTESNGSGSVSDSHVYTTAGVYQVILTVTDKDGGSGSQIFQYISVYNPTSQGLFSAGQVYTSPAGALTANTNATGMVLFGLSYKYQGTVPTGNRQFSMDFNTANFHFNATSVSSLVIANGMGTLTGTGTINNAGTYTFLVTGQESTNTIRIKITDQSGNVVYDTQSGASDVTTPTTPVTGKVLAH